MTTFVLKHQTARQDFREILDRSAKERKVAQGDLDRTTFIEALIIPDNTNIEFFRKIYNDGALLVLATNSCDAQAFVATLKRLMQHEKYYKYRLEVSSYYTISVYEKK